MNKKNHHPLQKQGTSAICPKKPSIGFSKLDEEQLKAVVGGVLEMEDPKENPSSRG